MTPDDERAAWDTILAVRSADDPEAALAAAPDHALIRLFGPVARGSARRPVAVAQFGQSLDGRIATPTGHSHYINCPAALTHLHRLRAVVDAVVVGVGTALADDPQLTVRHAPGQNPARVVLDPRARLPDDARLLEDDGARRLLCQAIDRPRPRGIEVIVLPVVDGGFSPRAVLDALAERGLHRVLIEGGGITVSRFLSAGVVDRLHICVAPLILGSGPTGLCLPPIARIQDAIRPRAAVHRVGEDVLFDCDLTGGGGLAAAAP